MRQLKQTTMHTMRAFWRLNAAAGGLMTVVSIVRVLASFSMTAVLPA